MPTWANPVMKLMTRHSTIVLATAFVLVLAVADVVVAVDFRIGSYSLRTR